LHPSWVFALTFLIIDFPILTEEPNQNFSWAAFFDQLIFQHSTSPISFEAIDDFLVLSDWLVPLALDSSILSVCACSEIPDLNHQKIEFVAYSPDLTNSVLAWFAFHPATCPVTAVGVAIYSVVEETAFAGIPPPEYFRH
jgi:hypothetical protein